ncbi:MAG: 23S rRNA (adenine(2503)-C(2))-methyltransferase RlmN [Terriglobales bacterium]
MILGLTLQQLTQLAADCGEPAFRGAQLFTGLYEHRIADIREITNLPVSLRDRLSAKHSVGLPQIEQKFHSADGTIRYLLRLADAETVETVWMPDGDGGEVGDREPVPLRQSSAGIVPGTDRRSTTFNRRATICVSSQAGCAADCKFCMTALLGLKRNLSAGEIVGQVIAVLNDRLGDLGPEPPTEHQRHRREEQLQSGSSFSSISKPTIQDPSLRVNLVFMGMGEPFLNYDNFMTAVRLLAQGVGIPPSRMTVSTVGIVPRIQEFGREEVRPKLAISLTASNDGLRERLMPINRKWNLEALIGAARDFPLRLRERLTFEYVLLRDVNDLPTNAREVADLVRGLRCKVNLIALNPGSEIPFQTPSDEQILRFQGVLVRAGIPTFIRRPRGRDIYAACGQLRATAG